MLSKILLTVTYLNCLLIADIYIINRIKHGKKNKESSSDLAENVLQEEYEEVIPDEFDLRIDAMKREIEEKKLNGVFDNPVEIISEEYERDYM